MSDLLIKATPALLDGWCGPVEYHGDTPTMRGTDGVWDAGNLYMKEYLRDGDYDDGLWLNMAVPEARDRVARVLATMTRLKADQGAMWMRMGLDVGWALVSGFTVERERRWNSTKVPGLATLNRADDARLPDGSRRVDAMALAMVWREVSDGPLARAERRAERKER